MSQLTQRNPYAVALEQVRAEQRRRELQSEADRVAHEAAVLARRDLELARSKSETLKGFIHEAWPILEPTTPLIWGWHLDALAEHLQAVTDGQIHEFLANVPPASMKSLMASVFWPAYEWGPAGLASERFLTTSHDMALAVRDNVRMRRLIKSDWYQSQWGESVQLMGDQDAKIKFENKATGSREAAAFANITGKRGSRIVIDDPHSTTSAESDVQRASTVTTFKEAIPSRGNSKDSATVVIMQRLHEHDVSGYIINELGTYTHLMIPMEFEPERRFYTKIGWTDPRKIEGSLMAPKMFPPEKVRTLKKIGAYAWASQYQQRPAPRQGGFFKVEKFNIVTAMPAGRLRRCRAWDLAATKLKPGVKPDFTVGALLAIDPEGFVFVEDIVRGQWSSNEVRKIVKATAARDGTDVKIHMPQDPGQAGKDQAESYVRLLLGYMVTAETVRGEKTLRADPYASQVEAGNVALLKAPWNAAYIEELRGFPAGHDDQVDASADAFTHLAASGAQGWFDYYAEEHARLTGGKNNDG